MFGHDDKDEDKNPPAGGEPIVSTPSEPVPDGSLGIVSGVSSPVVTAMDDASSSTVADDTTQDDSPVGPPPTQPTTASEPDEDLLPAHASGDASDDLLNIKQKALQQLSPLVDHLDQTPEEKFRTTMMMIQAADNQTLIGTAYSAAQEIKDEKTRAQALLDIVNEINYFTQQDKE